MFIVGRPTGSWEIRESARTPAGPRARTLASFRVLDEGVLDRVAERASEAVDRDRIIQEARLAGVPVDLSAADRAARTLLAEVARGRAPSVGLRKLLRPVVHGQAPEGIADWFGATPARRGAALRDLLDFADALPNPRRGALAFPGWRPHGAGV
jgi:hypothetical protein